VLQGFAAVLACEEDRRRGVEKAAVLVAERSEQREVASMRPEPEASSRRSVETRRGG
jgi:hypothetical protein